MTGVTCGARYTARLLKQLSNLRGVNVTQSLVFCAVFFHLSFFTVALPVLPFVVSDYPFDIFQFFSYENSCTITFNVLPEIQKYLFSIMLSLYSNHLLLIFVIFKFHSPYTDLEHGLGQWSSTSFFVIIVMLNF